MKVYCKGRWFSAIAACAIAVLMAVPAMAQDYGVGETRIIAQAPDSMVLDGVYDADIWDLGLLVDLKASTSFWSPDGKPMSAAEFVTPP